MNGRLASWGSSAEDGCVEPAGPGRSEQASGLADEAGAEDGRVLALRGFTRWTGCQRAPSGGSAAAGHGSDVKAGSERHGPRHSLASELDLLWRTRPELSGIQADPVH